MYSANWLVNELSSDKMAALRSGRRSSATSSARGSSAISAKLGRLLKAWLV